jgi:fructan beta-fructosidase
MEVFGNVRIDIFKLKVENSKEEKWVLFISINPGAPQGGSGTQYFIGNFDGKTFTTTQKDIKWVDYGTDNYAGVTYNNAPENKRIFVGWMSNWLYAQKTPTKNWRSAMTLPRELALEKINENFVVKSKPVKQFNEIVNQSFSKDLIEIPQNGKSVIEYARMNQSNIKFTAKDKNLKLVFSNDVNDSLVLKYDAKLKTFTIDRTHSGIIDFDASFAQKVHKTEIPNIVSETIDFHIIMDWSSIEVFLNNGVYSFTEQIFPKKPYTKMILQSDEKQEIRDIKIDEIKSIW